MRTHAYVQGAKKIALKNLLNKERTEENKMTYLLRSMTVFEAIFARDCKR